MSGNRNEFTDAVMRLLDDTKSLQEEAAKNKVTPFMFEEKSARGMRTWLKNKGEAEHKAYRQSVSRDTMIQQAKQIIKERGL